MTSKLELIEAFMAMNEETRLDIIRENLGLLASEEQVRNFQNQERTLQKKLLDETL